MISGHIENANICFRRPKDTTAEQCGDLYVRKELVDMGGGEMWVHLTSAWIPTPEELAALNAGGAVILSIASNVQPPVMLTVTVPRQTVPPAEFLSDETLKHLDELYKGAGKDGDGGKS